MKLARYYERLKYWQANDEVVLSFLQHDAARMLSHKYNIEEWEQGKPYLLADRLGRHFVIGDMFYLLHRVRGRPIEERSLLGPVRFVAEYSDQVHPGQVFALFDNALGICFEDFCFTKWLEIEFVKTSSTIPMEKTMMLAAEEHEEVLSQKGSKKLTMSGELFDAKDKTVYATARSLFIQPKGFTFEEAKAKNAEKDLAHLMDERLDRMRDFDGCVRLPESKFVVARNQWLRETVGKTVHQVLPQSWFSRGKFFLHVSDNNKAFVKFLWNSEGPVKKAHGASLATAMIESCLPQTNGLHLRKIWVEYFGGVHLMRTYEIKISKNKHTGSTFQTDVVDDEDGNVLVTGILEFASQTSNL